MRNKKNSEPKMPVRGKKVYTGKRGGTYTRSKSGREYFGNNGY